MGSPPQMETIGAPHSSDAARHCSTVIISLMVDLYSRMRPQPVQVRLQACSGSSIITIGNFFAPRKRLRGHVFREVRGHLQRISQFTLLSLLPVEFLRPHASIRRTA